MRRGEGLSGGGVRWCSSFRLSGFPGPSDTILLPPPFAATLPTSQVAENDTEDDTQVPMTKIHRTKRPQKTYLRTCHFRQYQANDSISILPT